MLDRELEVLLPFVLAHLQRLNEKFRLDNSSTSGLQIEKIRSASPLAPNALEHVINSYEEIGVLTGVTPGGLRNFHEFAL